MQPRRYHWLVGLVGLATLVMVTAYLGGFFTMSDAQSKNKRSGTLVDQTTPLATGLERATFGSGCFWCTEAVFQQLRGVQAVASGYSGGHVKDPTYRQVCEGTTGHAEVIQITYDPKVATFAELLEVFWKTHDPTTPNQQGNDHGPQYRSVVFHHNDDQRQQAEHYKKKLDEAAAFDAPIVTEISPFTAFYPAEDYHQNYFNDNPRQPYCSFVIQPKVEKFRKAFAGKLKENR